VTTAAGAPWRGRILALLGIVLVAFDLRSAVSAVSPLVGRIQHDIALGPVLVGVIGSLAPIAFAACGILGPLVARVLGLEGSLVGALALMVVGHLTRAVAPDAAVLLVGSVLALLGVGIGNVLLPPVVKRYFPDRVGTLTAVYATVLAIGTTAPALLGVPIADAAGWRVSLGVWAAGGVIAAVPWIAQLVAIRGRGVVDDAQRAGERTEARLEARLVGSRIAWALTGLFAASSITAYITFGWLPEILQGRSHLDAGTAGALLGLFSIMGFPVSLVVPMLATRLRSIWPLILVALVLSVVGFGGLLVAPAVPVPWVVIGGLGALWFPLCLFLINDRTRTEAGSVALSGFVQGIGYLAGAAGPLVVGILLSATGGWTVPLIFTVAALLLSVPSIFVLARRRSIEDELAERARRRAGGA
jgi:CP family cyanate transporter-like MFS transporter